LLNRSRSINFLVVRLRHTIFLLCVLFPLPSLLHQLFLPSFVVVSSLLHAQSLRFLGSRLYQVLLISSADQPALNRQSLDDPRWTSTCIQKHNPASPTQFTRARARPRSSFLPFIHPIPSVDDYRYHILPYPPLQRCRALCRRSSRTQLRA